MFKAPTTTIYYSYRKMNVPGKPIPIDNNITAVKKTPISLVARTALSPNEDVLRELSNNRREQQNVFSWTQEYQGVGTSTEQLRTSTRPDSVGVWLTGSVARHHSGHNDLSHTSPLVAFPGSAERFAQTGLGFGFTWNGRRLEGQSVHICRVRAYNSHDSATRQGTQVEAKRRGDGIMYLN